MARISLPEEVMKKDQEDIIEFLAEETKAIRANFRNAIKADQPYLLYASLVDVELVAGVLAALDRRNKEHTLK